MSSPVTQSAALAAEHDVGPGLSCGAPDNIHSEVVILTWRSRAGGPPT